MLKSLKNTSYFVEIELTKEEEELLSLLSNSRHMTISEYIRFLTFKKLQHFKKFKARGMRVIKNYTTLRN
jgi:hypothetical protein